MEWTEWERRESGPADAQHRVLLLPGGMCTASFYEELMAQPALRDLRLVALTLPGHGGTPPPPDLTVETTARLVAQAAADLRCTVVVGHSMGANVALEMVGAGGFAGPVVLLAPCFSRTDEAVFLRGLDRLSTVLGSLPYRAMIRMMPMAVKGMPVTPDRRATLGAELRRNDPGLMRRAIRAYLRYLDRYGSVAARLCDAGVPAWVVLGESGDGGATVDERRTLGACANVTMVTIPGRSFFTANEEPELVAGLVLDASGRVEAPN